jgi:hypothetical protein
VRNDVTLGVSAFDAADNTSTRPIISGTTAACPPSSAARARSPNRSRATRQASRGRLRDGDTHLGSPTASTRSIGTSGVRNGGGRRHRGPLPVRVLRGADGLLDGAETGRVWLLSTRHATNPAWPNINPLCTPGGQYPEAECCRRARRVRGFDRILAVARHQPRDGGVARLRRPVDAGRDPLLHRRPASGFGSPRSIPPGRPCTCCSTTGIRAGRTRTCTREHGARVGRVCGLGARLAAGTRAVTGQSSTPNTIGPERTTVAVLASRRGFRCLRGELDAGLPSARSRSKALPSVSERSSRDSWPP